MPITVQISIVLRSVFLCKRAIVVIPLAIDSQFSLVSLMCGLLLSIQIHTTLCPEYTMALCMMSSCTSSGLIHNDHLKWKDGSVDFTLSRLP